MERLRNIDSVQVKVRPGARKNEVLKFEDELVVAISAKPEDGKANLELEKYLSKLSGKKAVIKSGFSSKRKLVIFQ